MNLTNQHFYAEGMLVKFEIRYKKYEKQGTMRLFFPSGYLKINIKNYEAKYTSPTGSPLTPAINAVLADNRQEIIKSMSPYLEKEVAKKILIASNKFSKHYTFDELCPDRK